jgi:hypothetical protein
VLSVTWDGDWTLGSRPCLGDGLLCVHATLLWHTHVVSPCAIMGCWTVNLYVPRLCTFRTPDTGAAGPRVILPPRIHTESGPCVRPRQGSRLPRCRSVLLATVHAHAACYQCHSLAVYRITTCDIGMDTATCALCLAEESLSGP